MYLEKDTAGVIRPSIYFMAIPSLRKFTYKRDQCCIILELNNQNVVFFTEGLNQGLMDVDADVVEISW